MSVIVKDLTFSPCAIYRSFLYLDKILNSLQKTMLHFYSVFSDNSPKMCQSASVSRACMGVTVSTFRLPGRFLQNYLSLRSSSYLSSRLGLCQNLTYLEYEHSTVKPYTISDSKTFTGSAPVNRHIAYFQYGERNIRSGHIGIPSG